MLDQTVSSMEPSGHRENELLEKGLAPDLNASLARIIHD